MNRIVMGLPLLVLLCIAVGCSNGLPPKATAVLQEAKTFELYSLDPRADETLVGERLHNWHVLGKTAPAKPDRKEIISSIEKGVAENRGEVAGCFDPRHAIRVEQDGQTHDFLICFRCMQIEWYVDDRKQETILTSRSPQPTLDAILKSGGIPLAPKSD